ncbi:MAG TPA: ABC transporter ATP-binding protein [Acidimicrobiales bacterium]|nr:ABC transporter ATP-binding protein [Acidimicrobiales bacterium]
MSEGDRPSVPAVEVSGAVKVYGGGVRALDGLDLVVQEGEFVTITGPSGCGKSTLLHLLAALDHPDAGTLTVHGRDLARLHNLSRYRRREVGLVFQLHNLLPRLSATANVEVAMFGAGQDRHARRARALDLLSQVDLSGREERLPTQLSGGERQRVAIARALANHPGLLLADEPTGNLDSEATERIVELLRSVNASGITVLLVTHDAQVTAHATRVVSMRAGRVVDDRMMEPVRALGGGVAGRAVEG